MNKKVTFQMEKMRMFTAGLMGARRDTLAVSYMLLLAIKHSVRIQNIQIETNITEIVLRKVLLSYFICHH